MAKIINRNDKKNINNIINEINNNANYCKHFNHHKQKYKTEELLEGIIILLKLKISYRNVKLYTTINWNTLYKFRLKLIKIGLYEKLYTLYNNT